MDPRSSSVEAVGNYEKNKVNLDTILTEEIGQFGKFQLRTIAFTTPVILFISWAVGEYLFTTGRIGTRCLIPECEDAAQAQFVPEWLPNAVPGGSSAGSFDNCQRFGNASAPAPAPGTCPATLFDTATLVPCEHYVYENTHSIVYDFGMACDEWQRSLVGSLRTAGSLLALPITGYMSDRWGRSTTFALNAFCTAFLGLTRYWAGSYIGFIFSEVIEATFGAGTFSCAYILLLELVGPKYRVTAGAMLSTAFASGNIALGLLAWAVPNWRMLTLTLYIPQLITIFYFWIMPESARWYMGKGRYEESEALLKEVARVNGKQLSQRSLEALRLTAEEDKQKAQTQKKEPWLIVLVFRHKRILIRCLVSPVWWITTTLIYYGLSINAVNMSGNRYLNYMAVSAAEIPGFWTAVLLLGKVGRKPVLMGAFWICAACQVAFIFTPEELYGLSLTGFLVGKYAIAVVATSLYTYTAELFPTRHRHSLFAFSSMMGRIGSIIAPLTPAFGAATFEEFPFVMFGAMALVSGLLVFVTPETLGTKLPDTMEEASTIGLSQ